MTRHKRKEFSFPILLLMGAGFALGSVVAVALMLAVISYFTADPTALTGAFSLLALAIAGAISGFSTSRVRGEGGVLIGVVSAMIATAVMLAVGLVWRGGLLPLGAILNLAVFLITSVFSALAGKRRKRKSYAWRK